MPTGAQAPALRYCVGKMLGLGSLASGRFIGAPFNLQRGDGGGRAWQCDLDSTLESAMSSQPVLLLPAMTVAELASHPAALALHECLR